jgi:shikimate dehydrogenase
MTTPYAEVIGDPIAHSKSPLIHRFWLDALGLEADYRLAHVRPEELADYIGGRSEDPDWMGCNVTIPHKQAVMPLLNMLQRQASRVGAVNCVYRMQGRLVGENSDVDGILEALGANGDGRSFGSACLIGAGGAARAAVHALETAGAREVRVIVRDSVKGQALLDSFGVRGRACPVEDAALAMAGANVVINASPLGMIGAAEQPEPVLAALAATAPGALVFDMVYAPLETALLRRAQALGRETADGLTMLIGQAAVAFRLFFGEPAPREHDAQLRALLTA